MRKNKVVLMLQAVILLAMLFAAYTMVNRGESVDNAIAATIVFVLLCIATWII